MRGEELPEVHTKERWGHKRGQRYEVSNGDEIHHTCAKKFIVDLGQVDGRDNGGKGVTVQVCDVHKPLMSV